MRDFTIDNLTEIVLEEYGSKTEYPRFKQIITSLLKHLHRLCQRCGIDGRGMVQGDHVFNQDRPDLR